MIAIATSTRADWGLLTPLADELRQRGIPIAVLASNMHLLPRMGLTVNEIEAAGHEPQRLPTAGATPVETSANTLLLYGKWFGEHRPRAVVILGDRYEMLAVASAATLQGVPIIHIAGGTVSEGAMDNAIRNAITQLATLHLAETALCARRLTAMGVEGKDILVAGALGVWNAANVPLMSRRELEESLGRRLPDKYFVGTLHAATLDTLSPEDQMREFLAGLEQFINSEPDYGAILTYPNNDTDPLPLIAQLKKLASRHPGRILLMPSLGMRRYLSAVSLSEGVIGNSSSGVVEVASLGVPTLDIGIRQKGRERAPSVAHAASDAASILAGLRQICSKQAKALAAKRENPYFTPGTPRIMADRIETFAGCLSHDG